MLKLLRRDAEKTLMEEIFFSIRDDVAAAGWGRGGASSVERSDGRRVRVELHTHEQSCDQVLFEARL